MVDRSKIANRYARAIFLTLRGGRDLEKVGLEKVSLENVPLEKVIEELSSLSSVISGHREAMRLFSSEVFSLEDQKNVVSDLVKAMKLSDTTRKIISVIAEMRRTAFLGEISNRLRQLVLEAANVIPVEVESSVALDRKLQEKIESRFKELLGKNVEASYQVNPNCLGGLLVKAAGKTYDGTVLGWLGGFTETVIRGGL